jgi:hypothetical protein
VKEQIAFDLGAEALAVPDAAVTAAMLMPEDREPVAIRQLELTVLPVALPADERTTLFDRVLPRLFHRGSRNGRELRDGVVVSGAPRITGPGQYSFRQRRADGHWRLVTIFTFGVIKSITEWSRYTPNHQEAA